MSIHINGSINNSMTRKNQKDKENKIQRLKSNQIKSNQEKM